MTPPSGLQLVEPDGQSDSEWQTTPLDMLVPVMMPSWHCPVQNVPAPVVSPMQHTIAAGQSSGPSQRRQVAEAVGAWHDPLQQAAPGVTHVPPSQVTVELGTVIVGVQEPSGPASAGGGSMLQTG
jgi:hypothetical protein